MGKQHDFAQACCLTSFHRTVMAHLLNLVAGVLMHAGAQSSDMADSSMHQGFLSKYSGSDASKTSLSDYHKFVTHRFNHMKYGGAPDALSHHNGLGEFDASTMVTKPAHPAAPAQDSMALMSAWEQPMIAKNDFDPPNIVDKEEEEKAAQKVFAKHSSMAVGLSAIGVSLLTLAAMLEVRMRRGLQQTTTLASSSGHESTCLQSWHQCPLTTSWS